MNRPISVSVSVLGAIAFCTVGAAFAAEVTPQTVAFAEDGSIAESLTGTPGDPAAGAKTMVERSLGNCAACHVIGTMPDVPFQGTIGPALDGAGDRYSEAQLRGIVADAKHTFPDSMMPSFFKSTGFIRPGEGFTSKPATEPVKPLLTAQQVEDITAYLLTMK
ncbi:sulfur oxidation c-type cytochrome SoxX [Paracoccus suum]|uniref:Sulfur oxidation c-type cytochrome SoxX n=1 Tax=Paracoccus suum TaxID=2259340 RepID=A0A344PP36_9RHOB|nr:sulfur oxidation c-type cytochrome SoxX [Paracoccus suum]AXC51141.1 sulfur oxidation c-type cytochrome SoxX [Paracoccus suum]